MKGLEGKRYKVRYPGSELDVLHVFFLKKNKNKNKINRHSGFVVFLEATGLLLLQKNVEAGARYPKKA